MAIYHFKALTESGLKETGKIDTKDRAEAFQQLMARKLRPLTLEEVSEKTPTAQNSFSRVSNETLLMFTEELVQLLEAGLPLERALNIIEQRKEKSPIIPIATFLRQQIREGKSFSTALQNTGGAFSELYCHMVAAGEASGALPQILKRQTQHLTLLSELRRRVSAALVYPSIVFVAGIVLMLIFITVLLPQLTMLLSKTDQSLPFMTRALIGTSTFIGHYWWALLAFAILTISSLKVWKKTPAGKQTWDIFLLKVPLVGQILRIRFLTEFLQTLSTLVASGIPLLHGLSFMKKTVDNSYLKTLVEAICNKIAEGKSFSRTLRQNTFFPTVLADIIAVGEETGNLAGALERAATRYDRELTARIQQITALIQPLTILVVAIFVGIVAYSMITGILSSLSGLKR